MAKKRFKGKLQSFLRVTSSHIFLFFCKFCLTQTFPSDFLKIKLFYFRLMLLLPELDSPRRSSTSPLNRLVIITCCNCYHIFKFINFIQNFKIIQLEKRINFLFEYFHIISKGEKLIQAIQNATKTLSKTFVRQFIATLKVMF